MARDVHYQQTHKHVIIIIRYSYYFSSSQNNLTNFNIKYIDIKNDMKKVTTAVVHRILQFEMQQPVQLFEGNII